MSANHPRGGVSFPNASPASALARHPGRSHFTGWVVSVVTGDDGTQRAGCKSSASSGRMHVCPYNPPYRPSRKLLRYV